MVVTKARRLAQLGFALTLILGTAHHDLTHAGSTLRVEAEWDYGPLQTSDLIVRGVVAGVSDREVSSSDFWMEAPGSGPAKEVAFVTLRVDEVLRGPAISGDFTFMVYRDPSETRVVYNVGSEMLACLYWHDRLNTYYQMHYYSRYARSGQGWRSGPTPSGDRTFADGDVRNIVEETAIQTVASNAELVVEGVIESMSTERVYGPDSTSADLVTLTLQVDDVKKGSVAENPLPIIILTRGIYWPEWRREVPRSYSVGQRWLCFLRKNELGWYPYAGSNGLFRIEGAKLIYADRVEYWKAERMSRVQW